MRLTFIYPSLPDRSGRNRGIRVRGGDELGTDRSSSPNLFVSLQTKGTYSTARTATRNWGDAIKVQRHLRNMSFTRRFFPTGTRDGGRREPCEPQPCSLGEKECLS